MLPHAEKILLQKNDHNYQENKYFNEKFAFPIFLICYNVNLV